MTGRTPLDFLFRQAKNELSDTEKIALIVYWATEKQGNREISASGVRSLARDAKTGVKSKSVSGLLSYLRKKGVAGKGDSGYYLTMDGKSRVESLVELSETATSPRDDDFISVADPNDDFYSPLIDDINRCYRVGVNDAVLILVRKLIENLLIDILRGHYGNQRINLFYIPRRGRFHSFSSLLENLRDNKSDFKMYYLEIENLLKEIDEFRESANASAHSIEVRVPDKRLESMASRATKLVKRCLRIKKQIEAASG